MNTYKKLFTPQALIVVAGIIGISVWVHFNNTDPLDIDLDQAKHTLKTYTKPNKPLLVSFWASWCEHCIKEAIVLKQLKKQHPELEIIGIQVDTESPAAVFQNTGYHNMQANQNTAQIMSKFGNYSAAVPFILILNKNGDNHTFVGETNIEELEHALNLPPTKDQTQRRTNN